MVTHFFLRDQLENKAFLALPDQLDHLVILDRKEWLETPDQLDLRETRDLRGTQAVLEPMERRVLLDLLVI